MHRAFRSVRLPIVETILTTCDYGMLRTHVAPGAVDHCPPDMVRRDRRVARERERDRRAAGAREPLSPMDRFRSGDNVRVRRPLPGVETALRRAASVRPLGPGRASRLPKRRTASTAGQARAEGPARRRRPVQAALLQFRHDHCGEIVERAAARPPMHRTGARQPRVTRWAKFRGSRQPPSLDQAARIRSRCVKPTAAGRAVLHGPGAPQGAQPTTITQATRSAGTNIFGFPYSS